jgi:hypothetical protein
MTVAGIAASMSKSGSSPKDFGPRKAAIVDDGMSVSPRLDEPFVELMGWDPVAAVAVFHHFG